MRFVVLEPSGRVKRAQVGAPVAAGTAPAGDEEARRATLAAALEALRSLRSATQADPVGAADVLREALTAEGIAVIRAEDAGSAARSIAGLLAADVQRPRGVVTNNSSAVKEIRAALETLGVRILPGYPGRELPATEQVVTRGWQLPREPAVQAGATFAEHLPRIRADSAAPAGATGPAASPDGRRDVTALLGVSAAGADGTLIWAQHHENISHALRSAGRLILVVPVDKVLPDSEAARLQVDVTAAYGWAPRLLDAVEPAASREAEELWEGAAAHAGGPATTVVLLDNGRSILRGGHYESLLRCISCRACRTNCPTQRWFGGELHMSPVEYVRFFLLGLHDDVELCVGCGNCVQSCPVDIEIPELIARLRDERRLAHYTRDFFTMNPELVGRWGQAVLAGSPGGRRAGVLAETVAGIHRDAHLPPYAPEDFFTYMSGHTPLSSRRRVVLFSGCFVNYHDQQQGTATVRLLERAGFRVDVPHHHCCDIPKLQGGTWDHARSHAEENLRVLEHAARGAEAIVTGCPSCARALSEFYPQLLGREAAWLEDGVCELFRFLRDAGFDPATEVGGTRAQHEAGGSATVGAQPGDRPSLLYHSPCHYPGVDPERSVLWFLERAGAEFTEVDRGCCGMSGSFGYKARFHDLAMEVGADIFARVEECADMELITNCGACRLQLQQGTGRSVPHAAVVLEGLLAKEDSG